MANITKVLGRHDWREQKIPQLRTGLNDDPKRMKLLCWNCRKPWDEENMGSPPLTGCISDIKVRNVGDARMRDYAKQESHLMDEHDRRATAADREHDRQMQAYLDEQRRRRG